MLCMFRAKKSRQRLEKSMNHNLTLFRGPLAFAPNLF